MAGSTLTNNGYKLSSSDTRRFVDVLYSLFSLLYESPIRIAQVLITVLNELLDAKFGIQLQKLNVGDLPSKASNKFLK